MGQGIEGIISEFQLFCKVELYIYILYRDPPRSRRRQAKIKPIFIPSCCELCFYPMGNKLVVLYPEKNLMIASRKLL